MIARVLALCLLAGCTVAPVKEAYVAWNSGCTNGPTVVKVRFVDTPAPVISCLQAAPPAGKGVIVLATLLGAPPWGCMIAWPDHAEIHATISPGLPQLIGFVGTLQTPEQILTHELRMAFGFKEVLPTGWADVCAKAAT
jgi:hypothetical protein